jgi:hypothetical protein
MKPSLSRIADATRAVRFGRGVSYRDRAFSQDLFQPLCLLFCNRLIHRRGIVAQKELLAAAVTPEGSHLLETYSFLAAALLYCHRMHVSPQVFLLLTSVAVSQVKPNADSRATHGPHRRSCQGQSLIQLL